MSRWPYASGLDLRRESPECPICGEYLERGCAHVWPPREEDRRSQPTGEWGADPNFRRVLRPEDQVF